jgi:hypothetical protein
MSEIVKLLCHMIRIAFQLHMWHTYNFYQPGWKYLTMRKNYTSLLTKFNMYASFQAGFIGLQYIIKKSSYLLAFFVYSFPLYLSSELHCSYFTCIKDVNQHFFRVTVQPLVPPCHPDTLGPRNVTGPNWQLILRQNLVQEAKNGWNWWL